MSAKVVAFNTRRVPRDFGSLQSKIECYQKVPREWGAYLTANESAILTVLIDRTIGWSRREAYFSTRALLSGDATYVGVNMSRATMFRVLNTLENKGLIARRKDPNVPDRVHFTVNMEWSPVPLNVPKRLQGRSHSETDRSQDDTDRSHNDTLYTGITKQVSPTGIIPAASGDDRPNPVSSIRAKLAVASADHAQAATASKAKRIERNNAAGVEAAWRASARDAFPSHVEPVWTGREKGQANRVAKGWTHAKQISFVEFTEWAVTNWTQIMGKQFRWMKDNKPPAVPAFSFYVHFLSQFAECWAEGKLREWGDDKQRTRVEKLMSRGMTFEQAVAEDAKANVAGELRKDMEKREIMVRARVREADGKLQQAAKLAEYGGKAPPHPRSRAALEARAAVQPRSRQRVAPAPVIDEEMPPLNLTLIDMSRNPYDD